MIHSILSSQALYNRSPEDSIFLYFQLMEYLQVEETIILVASFAPRLYFQGLCLIKWPKIHSFLKHSLDRRVSHPFLKLSKLGFDCMCMKNVRQIQSLIYYIIIHGSTLFGFCEFSQFKESRLNTVYSPHRVFERVNEAQNDSHCLDNFNLLRLKVCQLLWFGLIVRLVSIVTECSLVTAQSAYLTTHPYLLHLYLLPLYLLHPYILHTSIPTTNVPTTLTIFETDNFLEFLYEGFLNF